MVGIRSSIRSTLVIILLAAGPMVVAAFLFPDPRKLPILIAVLVGIATGVVLAYIGLGLIRSRVLTEPGWRRPSRGRTDRSGTPRRDYLAPMELPPPPGLVVGRDRELESTMRYLTKRRRPARPVVLISGPPGVGKSSLALGVGQLLADRYPRGQLLVRLDRLGPDEDLTSVLRMFVVALQEPGDLLPADEAGLRRRYRTLTRRRRVLVILDAATRLDQVYQLAPAGRRCALIVTTEEMWVGIPQSWLHLTIDRLDTEDALGVLRALVGPDRVAADESTARRIVDAAGRIPFALQLAGVALAARHHWTLSLAVQRLVETRLPRQYRTGLPDYAEALELAYALMTSQERRCLALLGIVGEKRFAVWELAALLCGADPDCGGDAGVLKDTEALAQRVLDRLVLARFVERRIDDASGAAYYHVPGQLRAYVAARLVADIDEPDRVRAADRRREVRYARGEARADELLYDSVYRQLNDGHLSTARRIAKEALALCAEQRHWAASDAELERLRGQEWYARAALAEVETELGWLEEARQHAQAARHAHAPECRARALRCLGVVNRRLRQAGRADSLLAEAERAIGERDRTELIRILRERALTLALIPDADGALHAVDRAVELCRRSTGRDQWLASVLCAKGNVLYLQKRYEEADRTLIEAESVALDPRYGQALWVPWIVHERALVAVANGLPSLGRDYAERACKLFGEMQHRYGIAHCRLVVGRALLAEGGAEEATPRLEEALHTFAGCGDRWSEAYTRLPLAQALRHTDRGDEAVKALLQAAQDFDDLGDLPRRDSARTLLDQIQRERRDTDESRVWRRAFQLAGRRVRE